MAKDNKLICCDCGESKAPTTGFYISRSSMFKNNSGRMPICKKCLFEKYNVYMKYYNDLEKAMYHLCMNLDIYFSKTLFESSFSQENINNTPEGILSIYLKNLNSLPQYRKMTSINSDHIILDDKNDIRQEEYIEDEINYDKMKIPIEVKKRWGSGYSNENYIFLEESYQEFYDAYPHDTPAERLLLKQLSKSLLEGEICRRSGDRNGYEKMNKLVSSMLTDSNIKPSQKKNMGDEIGECFGVFIENVEKNEPIPDRIGEFEDVDGIGEYMDRHFVRNFAKVFGLIGDDNENEN